MIAWELKVTSNGSSLPKTPGDSPNDLPELHSVRRRNVQICEPICRAISRINLRGG
jgi:hypothetical protein